MTGINGTAVILGSGTSTGVPVIGCDCPVCRSGDPRNQRTRCSVLLIWDERRVLIDTSTDLRLQALRENLRRLDGVLFTHTHADHVHGIDELRVFNLRQSEPIPLYGSPQTVDSLRRNFSYIFAASEGTGFRPRLSLTEIEDFTPFQLCDLPITPLPLQHGKGESTGYRVGDFAYLTDCNGVPAATVEALGGVATLVIDALRFRPHETHFTVSGAIEIARAVRPRRTILTHLGHDVDFLRHGGELPAGIEFAYDGQQVPFTVAAAATAC